MFVCKSGFGGKFYDGKTETRSQEEARDRCLCFLLNAVSVYNTSLFHMFTF